MEGLFKKGIGFRSYIFNLDENTKHDIMKYYIPINVNDEIRKQVNGIDKTIKVIGVVDPLCDNCKINLPMLEKIISTNPRIELRLVIEKVLGNELDDYKIDGILKLPIFLFMDETFKIIGSLSEELFTANGGSIKKIDSQGFLDKSEQDGFVEEMAEGILAIMSRE